MLATTLPGPYLTAVINDQQILKYLSVIGPTILVYDWFLTIDSELTHVWSRRWGIIEILYLTSRYLPFVDTPIMLIYHFYLVDPSIEACHIALSAQVMLYSLGTIMSEQIFMIRTWAVWERNKVVGLVLFIQAVTSAVVELYASGVYANSLTFLQGYNLGGCFVLTSSKMILLGICLFLLKQLTNLILIVLKTYPAAKSEPRISRLSNVILQDGERSDYTWLSVTLTITGVLFYVMTSVLFIVVLAFLFQPGIMSAVLTVPTRICYSIFASRMILHIRDVNKQRTKDAFTSTAIMGPMFSDVLGQIEFEMEERATWMARHQDQI